MPKVIELTVQIDVQKVSCPGVWLCQSGRVSLIVFALGTSYQTCLLPPIFPLLFRDAFYFRKRFQETCALNNICCLLKDETIYCELVQWSDSCNSGKCVMLAQYLGSLNDVLFPPNMCSNDGIDLLMRRSKGFPGILSPKIEITTKVRIDELWNQKNKNVMINATKCHCVPRPDFDGYRQKPVCHTPMYHRAKCNSQRITQPTNRPCSRSASVESRSCTSFEPKEKVVCGCPKFDKNTRVNSSPSTRRSSPARPIRGRPCNIYYVETSMANPWRSNNVSACDEHAKDYDYDIGSSNSEQYLSGSVKASLPEEEHMQKVLIESRYVDDRRYSCATRSRREHRATPGQPCICDICKRYHELFHTNCDDRR